MNVRTVRRTSPLGAAPIAVPSSLYQRVLSPRSSFGILIRQRAVFFGPSPGAARSRSKVLSRVGAGLYSRP